MSRKWVQRKLLKWVICLGFLGAGIEEGRAQPQQSYGVALQKASSGAHVNLGEVYMMWRKSMMTKDVRLWMQMTARSRQIKTKNRILSERKPFPASIFSVPAQPPSLQGLKLIQRTIKGRTAKNVYFGPINFGVGGDPKENLLILSFVNEQGRWTYDRAEFLNLVAIPDVVKQLRSGNLSYLKGKPEFVADGVISPSRIQLTQMVPLIAKVYVFCPGREVKVLVNGKSHHQFNNTKSAELVIGGGRPGVNEIQWSTKVVEGAKGTDPLAIRVYLLSQVPGVKPIKAYEYLVSEKEVARPVLTERFEVTAAMRARLQGARR